MSFISVRNLVHKYQKKDTEGNVIDEYAALHDISLEIQRGQFIAILGENGSGKSTFARHLNQLLFPDEGSIWIDEIEVREEDREMIWNNRKKIGMVFQNPDNQIVGITVEEDIAFGAENIGVRTEELQARVEHALRNVGMANSNKLSPNHLSGGQKQRIAVAGILAMHPQCIILDEASAMLDPQGRQELLDTVLRLNREEQMTIIWITHDMNEAVFAQWIFVMSKGRIELQGTPKQVFSETEKIKKLGMQLPLFTELSLRLHHDGYEIPEGILDVQEFIDAYEKAWLKNDKI